MTPPDAEHVVSHSFDDHPYYIRHLQRYRMRSHAKRNLRTLKALPALLLALLLCACSSNPGTPSVPPNATLPEIGIQDLDPDAVPTTAPESTEAPAESTAAADTEPEPAETTKASEAPETTEAAAPSTEESTEAPTVETEEPETPPAPTRSSSTGYRVWIGDSRFVGIHDSVSYDPERDYFISGWGVAYYWFINTALPAFNAFASQHPVSVVYWSLGANDISKEVSAGNYESADKYSIELNKLIEKYPNTTFYILSFGPIGGDGKKPSDVKDADAYNMALSSFTDYVFTHTTASYIDQGEYIESIGYTTSDGRHYDAATNKKIYDYILSQSGY